MTKSELVRHVTERNPHLFLRDIERVIDAIFNSITGALAQGDRIEIRGFGTFSVRRRDARKGRNPRTGAPVSVGAKYHPFFKMGKGLRDRLNKGL